jgi:hypothetical protein
MEPFINRYREEQEDFIEVWNKFRIGSLILAEFDGKGERYENRLRTITNLNFFKFQGQTPVLYILGLSDEVARTLIGDWSTIRR